MIIFNWEKAVISQARQWPHEGFIYEFFKFWSDYHESIWPFLIFVCALGFYFGWQKLKRPALLSVVAVLLADLASRRIVKAFVMRPRPNFVDDLTCHVGKCWGFVSSHSTNVAAVAVVLTLYNRKNWIWTLPSVILVSLSRIYLIDHFPLDVIGGIILGALVGVIIWIVYQYILLKHSEVRS